MGKKAGIVGAIVVGLVVCLAILLVVIKAVWGWVVPDIFAGAVQQGLIVGTLTYWQAFKIVVICGVLLGGSQVKVSKS